VDVVRVTLVVVIILSPILASKFIEFYNPPDYLTFAWDGVVEGFTLLRRNSTYLTVVITIVFSLAVASIAYALSMTWRFRILLTEDSITVERLFPMKTSYKIPVKSIVSVEVVQSSIGKRLNYGNLIIVTEALGTILIPKIERPIELRNLIIERYAKTTGKPEPIPGSGNYTVDDAPTRSVTLKPDASCPICMNSILASASSEVFLSVCPFCSSVFHTSCLVRWMKKFGYKCPVCGKNLSPPLGD
ncbi:PH domain-containing protein, partial [Candidatus Bathyarchaeota archaeon]|nr:PH domain-containing protein [Candidatus Bathyarchaeota archaeon]